MPTSSLLPNGPISDYLKRIEITEEDFFADLKKRDPAITSVYAAEEVAYYIRAMFEEMDQQGGPGGIDDEGGGKREGGWW